MYIKNTLPAHHQPLHPDDAATLSVQGAQAVQSALALRGGAQPTPLHTLPALAAELSVSSLHIKDEGYRLGLGSFKALGGAYALMRLVQQQASEQLGREVALDELMADAVRAVAQQMVFACATDGNHGKSVAQGAALMGATAKIFVHAGVSQSRADAIASFGAEIIRVQGNYDDSVEEASRVAKTQGWTVLSDMSWPGYEHIPSLVMQGYTAIVQEALQQLPEPPTHVLLQAGVGGFAAAVAGHLQVVLGQQCPRVTVVEPARAACLFDSAKAGRAIKIDEQEATVMAMLECYEPSMVAWRVLERVAEGFLLVDEEDALAAMRRLAAPTGSDPAVVAGESGGAGLAGLMRAAHNPDTAAAMGLDKSARVLLINTEGATDPALYAQLVGKSAEAVLGG